MNYLYCIPYCSLYYALYLISEGKPVTIITYNEGIKKFCEYMNIKCVFSPIPKQSLKSLSGLLIFKRRINSMLDSLCIEKNDKFFFFGALFSCQLFYIAKEFSKRCKVSFKEIESAKFSRNYDSVGFSKKYILKRKISKTFLEVGLGMKMHLYNIGGRNLVVGIDQNIFRKYNIEIWNLNKNLVDLTIEVIKKFPMKGESYDNVLFTTYPYGHEIWGKNTELQLCDFLYKLDNSIAIKNHPVGINSAELLREANNVFKKFKTIPYYLPGELLFNKVKKNVLAISSDVLITASKMENIRAISLLELIEWKKLAYKAYLKNKLIRCSDNRIIFVNSFNQLKELLK